MTKCTGTNLTQGDHEGWVEQTQVRPVCVVHYSPGTDRETRSKTTSCIEHVVN